MATQSTIATQYQISLEDPNGTRLAYIPDFLALDLARRVNDVGTLQITIPINPYSKYIARDCRIRVERSVNGGPFYLEGGTLWFVRKGEIDLSDGGEYLLKLTCEDAMTALKRRAVLYTAGSSYATKTGNADNIMKAIVRENLGSSSLCTVPGVDNNLRNMSSLLTVQPDFSQGASVSKSFAWRQVLPVLQELALASFQAGTYLAFDVVYTGATAPLEFRTYTGQRGINRSWSNSAGASPSPIPLVLSPSSGSLSDVQRITDWTDEVTFLVTGGQGNGDQRILGSSKDSLRIGNTPLGWIESFVDDTNTTDTTTLNSDADAKLKENRPVTLFMAKAVQQPGAFYGLDYGFGDIITAQFTSELLDCRVDAYQITVQNGKEDVKVALQYAY